MQKLKAIERVEDSFLKLPSVGKKSAERMSFALLNMSEEEVSEFANSLMSLKSQIHRCPICGMISDNENCPICSDPTRDTSVILVVSSPKDVFSLEKSEGYKGLYHVLNGEICLSKGQDVESLNIDSLLTRIEQGNIKEVILATNPTIDGETTALYISKLLQNKNLIVTRLAYGLQMGGNLDYTDQLTLLKALEGRRKI